MAALQVERDDGRGRVEHSTMMYEEAMSFVHKVRVCWCLPVSWCRGRECGGLGLCVCVCVCWYVARVCARV
jgi:hypothetical protein